MATLKSGGGAVRLYRHPTTQARIAVTAKSTVLIDRGDGWKRSRLRKSEIEPAGYRLYWTAPAGTAPINDDC